MLILILVISLALSSQIYAFQPERPAILVHGIGIGGGLTWKGIPLLDYLDLQNTSMADFLVQSGGYTLGKDLFIYEYDTLDPIEHIASEFSIFLERYLEETATTNVDLICFSMGGLVARTALSVMMDPPVKNLITIATPHKGSYWVEVAEYVKPKSTNWFFKFLGQFLNSLDPNSLNRQTYEFLDKAYRFSEYPSLQQMEPGGEFITHLETYYISPKVNVTCIAGYVLSSFDSAFLPKPLLDQIADNFGSGDLIVPLESAIWERANQSFIVKGRAETTWHSALTFNPEVQGIVKYILSHDAMLTQLNRLK